MERLRLEQTPGFATFQNPGRPLEELAGESSCAGGSSERAVKTPQMPNPIFVEAEQRLTWFMKY